MVRTIVKHLSTGPCAGLSSPVVRKVSLCGRGQAFGRSPIPVGYTLSTEGRPAGLVGSPEWEAAELRLRLQCLLLASAMAKPKYRQGVGPTGQRYQ